MINAIRGKVSADMLAFILVKLISRLCGHMDIFGDVYGNG